MRSVWGAVWEGCWVERMVRTRVQHVRGGWREPMWDVCKWDFGCFRGTGVGRFRDRLGWLRSMDRREFGVPQICAVVS